MHLSHTHEWQTIHRNFSCCFWNLSPLLCGDQASQGPVTASTELSRDSRTGPVTGDTGLLSWHRGFKDSPSALLSTPRTALPSKTLPLSTLPECSLSCSWGQTYTVISGSPNPFLSQRPFPCDSLKHLILSWHLLLRGIRPTQAGCLGLLLLRASLEKHSWQFLSCPQQWLAQQLALHLLFLLVCLASWLPCRMAGLSTLRQARLLGKLTQMQIRRNPWFPTRIFKTWTHTHLDLDPASFYRWDSVGPGETQSPSLTFFFLLRKRRGEGLHVLWFSLSCQILDSPLFVETSMAPLFSLILFSPSLRHYLGKTISLPLLLTNPFPVVGPTDIYFQGLSCSRIVLDEL